MIEALYVRVAILKGLLLFGLFQVRDDDLARAEEWVVLLFDTIFLYQAFIVI